MNDRKQTVEIHNKIFLDILKSITYWGKVGRYFKTQQTVTSAAQRTTGSKVCKVGCQEQLTTGSKVCKVGCQERGMLEAQEGVASGPLRVASGELQKIIVGQYELH